MLSHIALVVTLFASSAPEISPVLPAASRVVLEQWFLPDSNDAQSLKRIPIDDDQIGKRYSISFQSADGETVNGVLAMPAEPLQPARLAFALHAMGRTHEDWWNDDNPTLGWSITASLREQGYAVLALDARRHGNRERDDVGIRQILERAHTGAARRYQDMIIGTVRDYRTALVWANSQDDLATDEMVAVGYSMGAQMALLLASFEPNVRNVLAMVPPYVKQMASPVAPRNHVGSIGSARILMIGASNDPFSSNAQYEQVFASIATPKKRIVMFEGGHVLPSDYLDTALGFLADVGRNQ